MDTKDEIRLEQCARRRRFCCSFVLFLLSPTQNVGDSEHRKNGIFFSGQTMNMKWLMTISAAVVCFDLELSDWDDGKSVAKTKFVASFASKISSACDASSWVNFLVEINHGKLSSIMITFSSSLRRYLRFYAELSLTLFVYEFRVLRQKLVRKVCNVYFHNKIDSETVAGTEVKKTKSFSTSLAIIHDNGRRWGREKKFSINRRKEWSLSALMEAHEKKWEGGKKVFLALLT